MYSIPRQLEMIGRALVAPGEIVFSTGTRRADPGARRMRSSASGQLRLTGATGSRLQLHLASSPAKLGYGDVCHFKVKGDT